MHLSQHNVVFDLSVAPHPRLVSSVREFVEGVIGRLIQDPDAIFRVAMTAHELLENGVKYGTSQRIVVGVSVDRRVDGFDVTVRVTNDATEDDVHRLRTGIATVGAAPDPLLLYQTLMMQHVPGDRSGLGLARVRAEGEMSLDLEVEGRVITIQAVGHLPAGIRS
jgi:hypothetical protein